MFTIMTTMGLKNTESTAITRMLVTMMAPMTMTMMLVMKTGMVIINTMMTMMCNDPN